VAVGKGKEKGRRMRHANTWKKISNV